MFFLFPLPIFDLSLLAHSRIESDEYSQDMKLPFSSAPKIAFASAVLVASLLLCACADSSTGKKDDPHFFGTAGGANGVGAATGGMSFSW